MGKRELIALLNLSSWCLVMVGRLFLAVPRGCLQFVIVVFPDHTHLLFLQSSLNKRERSGYFTLIVLLMYCGSRCVFFPRSVMDRSAVCYCGIS